jgi:hypothetical protein
MQKKIKIGTEIKEIETKRTIQGIYKTNSCFFEKTNKIYKPLSKLTKTKRYGQVNKI